MLDIVHRSTANLLIKDCSSEHSDQEYAALKPSETKETEAQSI